MLDNPICAERRGKLTGIYQHSIDAKGRLFIPARLREELGTVFYVTLSMEEKCLWAFSNDSWERFTEKIKAMPIAKQIRMRAFYSHAAKCDLDGQGRILLPQTLRDAREIKRSITVVGAGDRAEFWDSEEFAVKDAKEMTPENIAAVFTEFDI